MKRVIALLLTLVMLLGLVPTALAAEAAAPDGTVVKAEEVSGTPRLDAMAENDSAVETTQPTGHQPRRKRLPPALPVRRSPPILPAAARRNRMPPFAGIRKRSLPRSRRPSPPLSRRRVPALPVPLS